MIKLIFFIKLYKNKMLKRYVYLKLFMPFLMKLQALDFKYKYPKNMNDKKF
jgi:hypothetical protein